MVVTSGNKSGFTLALRHRSKRFETGTTDSFDHGAALLWVTFSSILYSEFIGWYAWVNCSGELV